ncbi:hypothetical protein [Catenulispora subtropica]|uniref:Uncharacterized protein n=1 Tax=Catenulispora subtropica TaxID=450798 RepID=A0ABN2RKU3_9ACTN
MELIMVAVERSGMVGDRGLCAATLRYALQAVSAGSPRALEHAHVVVDEAGVYPARLVAGLYLASEPDLPGSARDAAVGLVRRALATSPLLADWAVEWAEGPYGYELLDDAEASVDTYRSYDPYRSLDGSIRI